MDIWSVTGDRELGSYPKSVLASYFGPSMSYSPVSSFQ